MPTDFWESLRLGFTQLRADCAIDPPVKPAGRLTAIWTAQPAPGQWRLDYSNAKDGYGVAKRFEWHAQSAAARLGFDENGQKAVWFWLDRVRRDAPESHIRAMNSVGLDGIEELYSFEILDICGLSAEFCRKCAADEMISLGAGADDVVSCRQQPDPKSTPDGGHPLTGAAGGPNDRIGSQEKPTAPVDANIFAGDGWVRDRQAEWREDAELARESEFQTTSATRTGAVPVAGVF
jgi:hypothetical protein